MAVDEHVQCRQQGVQAGHHTQAGGRLAAVTFGLAQCGLALLLRDRLRRAMSCPMARAAVALVNVSAMTIFLWHQTALMATTATGLLAGRLPGLHTLPDNLGRVAARLASRSSPWPWPSAGRPSAPTNRGPTARGTAPPE